MNKIIQLMVLIIGFVTIEAMDINKFFPGNKGNLTKITWAHAVNDRSKLQKALDSPVMMLEADVVFGKINGTGDSIPIMGHPPAIVSDLSLADFLTETYDFNKDKKNLSVRKGVKLDFKSTETFNKSIDIIQHLYHSIDYPFWLNADIIKGFVNVATEPVDADVFLSGAGSFGNSVLSLGWTTLQPLNITKYGDGQINAMVEAIRRNNVQQDVTFAVRAGIAAESPDQMRTLKDQVNNCTLTIWSSDGDHVDVQKLRNLILDFGADRVYVDVPADLQKQLDL